jgi:putative oxidoreductase
MGLLPLTSTFHHKPFIQESEMQNSINKVQDHSSTILRCFSGLTLLWVARHFIFNETLIKQLLWTGPLPFLTFLVGHLIIATHLAGGFMLIFGFVTRIAALIQLPFVLGAIAIHLGMESVPQDLAALYLAAPMLLALMTIAAFGPSKLSVDHWIGLDGPESDDNSEDSALEMVLLRSDAAFSEQAKVRVKMQTHLQEMGAQVIAEMEGYECPIEQARRQAA